MDADMTRRLERFFKPSLNLNWRGRKGNRAAFYYPDTPEDRTLLVQFLGAAGLDNKNSVRVAPDQIDLIGLTAEQNGLSLRLVGGPGEESESA